MHGRWLLRLAALVALSACSGRPASSHRSPAPSAATATQPSPSITLSRGQNSRLVIVAPGRLRDRAGAAGRKLSRQERAATKAAAKDRQRLADSVDDLALYLGRLRGGPVEIVESSSQEPAGTLSILIGELAAARFGSPGAHSIGNQTFRVVVQPRTIGLFGESDLATSYAIYELLDRLGCRWYMPGELGEVIPSHPDLKLSISDESLAPTTLYRNLWYVDDAFVRRNRLGGVKLSAGHHLERWLSDEQRLAHPEWRAVIGGRPHPSRLRWTEPAVAKAIADAILADPKASRAASVSLSPGDGSDFDQTTDKSADAGDWDPAANSVSLTDRLLVLVNRVATELHAQKPDLLFGLLAYSSYTRPPVRESVHPNVVPVLAPITYCRVRPWSDDTCPGAKDARRAFEGWSARADKLAFRSYGFNLAEPAAPNPMLRKWSYDLPFVFSHKTRFFQPETLPTFETTLPALYLGIRLAWDQRQEPAAILTELFQGFYGHAAAEVRAYTDIMDRAWTETPDWSGGGLGYEQRFPPALLAKARKAMKAAQLACQTDAERQRVALLDVSLTQLERYMQLARDFREGRLGSQESNFQTWLRQASELAQKYAPNSAFGGVRWAKADGAYAAYARRFLGPAYEEGARIAREQIVLGPPLCEAHFEAEPGVNVAALQAPKALAAEARRTNFCTETWSFLGLHDYFGTVRYSTTLDLRLSATKRNYLWLSKVDGLVRVWLDGTELLPSTPVPPQGLYLKPVTFEIPSQQAAHARTQREFVVAVQRTRLTELGAGGLLGPVYFYRDR